MTDCSLLSAGVGQKNLLRVFEPVILEHLNQPSRILPHLKTLIPLKVQRDIEEVERYSQEEATKRLIKALYDSDDVRWLDIFKDALAKEHFLPLCKRLNLEDVKDGSHYETLLQYHFPILLEVQSRNITTTLLQHNVITRRDVEEIDAKEQTHGATRAMQHLLLVLPVRHESWFQQLICAMRFNGYQRIVDEIYLDDISVGSDRQYNDSGQINHASRVENHSSVTSGQDQCDGADGYHCNSLTAFKTRCSSSRSREQTPSDARINMSSVRRCLANEDVHVDGPSVEDSVAYLDSRLDLSLYDFRSDGTNTAPSSLHGSSISLRTDEDNTLSSSSQLLSSNVTSVAEPLVLRGYQKELITNAVSGKNCLIIAPTGSGKTFVAIAIAQLCLDSATLENDSKIAFFVPTKTLVDQQFKQFIKYLKPGYRCQSISGDEVTTMSLSNVVEVNDVLVMTPQILLNALDSNELPSLSVFSLLIFDECHHMKKHYPYNDIMSRYYVDEKLSDSPMSLRLPQVVGLTASPGAGGANSVEMAAEHILELCANMDAVDISTVKNEQNLAEMMNCIKTATEDTAEVKGRLIDPFFNKISQTMKQIENPVQERGRLRALAAEIPDIEKATRPPAQQGSEAYVQFVATLKRVIAPVYDQKIRRIFVSCLRHLEVYNNALLINADCRTKDAVEYIRKEFQEFSKRRGSMAYDETDRWLDGLFTDMEQDLDEFSRSSACENPKLEKLQEIILSFYAQNEKAQGIVFCKTREMTYALMNWMKDSPSLAMLNPHNITGSNKTEKHGMTSRLLEDVLHYFKDGLHKILISTSVAEEGLDVEKCNYVIRYLHVTNDIARIQSRGRARAVNAQYVVLGDRERGTIVKDETNKLRERITKAALKFIDALDPVKVREKISRMQLKAKSERDIESKQNEFKTAVRQSRTHEGEYQLRCLKCDNLCGWSADIRTVNNQHYVIVDGTFEDRVVVQPHPNPRSYDDWEKKEKIHCKKCRQDWGIKANYQSVPCSVVKICSFVVVDPYEKRSYCKKWKDVTFPVAELSDQDIRDLFKFALKRA